MGTPLFKLRRFRWFHWLTRRLDFPWPARFPGTGHRLWMRFGPNLSLVVHPGGAEPAERARFLALAAWIEARVFWDIGANIGIYAFSFLAGDARRRALLLEPDPRNVACLERTLRGGLAARARVLPLAVGETPGQATFLLDPLTGATGQLAAASERSFVERHHRLVPPRATVEVTTLDRLLREGPPPDIVKLDIEGAELLALRGAGRLLGEIRPLLCLELSAPREPAVALLAAAGYRLFDWRDGKAAPQGSHACIAVPAERLGSGASTPGEATLEQALGPRHGSLAPTPACRRRGSPI